MYRGMNASDDGNKTNDSKYSSHAPQQTLFFELKMTELYSAVQNPCKLIPRGMEKEKKMNNQSCDRLPLVSSRHYYINVLVGLGGKGERAENEEKS